MLTLRTLFKSTIAALCLLLLFTEARIFAQDLTPVARLSTHVLLDVQWHPRQPIIAVGGDWGIKLFTDALQELAHIPSQVGTVISVSWNPNGEQLASAGGVGDGAIHIWNWDTSTNSLIPHALLSNNHEREFFLAWSPDGTRIASIGADTSSTQQLLGSIEIWDVENESLERTLSIQLESPTRSLAWSPDSTKIAFGGICPAERMTCPQGTSSGIFVADVSTGDIVQSLFTGNYLPNALSWTSGKIATSENPGVIVVYDADTLQKLNAFPLASFVNRVAWSPDGNRVAFSYDQASGGILNVLTGTTINLSLNYAYSGRITSLSWDSEGNRIASVTEDGVIEIWNTN